MDWLIGLTAILCLWPLALICAVKICDIDKEVEKATLHIQGVKENSIQSNPKRSVHETDGLYA